MQCRLRSGIYFPSACPLFQLHGSITKHSADSTSQFDYTNSALSLCSFLSEEMLQKQKLQKGGNFLWACIEKSATKESHTNVRQIENKKIVGEEWTLKWIKNAHPLKWENFQKGMCKSMKLRKKNIRGWIHRGTLLVFIQRTALMTFWG